MLPRFLSAKLVAVPLLALIACGGDDSPADPGGTAGGGAAPTGAGGSGGSGGVVECPEGSHDEGGVCTSTLSAWQAAPSIAEARDHHVTFVVETAAGPFMYVAGGAQDMEEAVYSIERAAIGEDGSLSEWQAETEELAAVGPSVLVAGQQVLIVGGLRAGGISAKTSLLTIGDDGAVSLAAGPAMHHERFHVAAVMHNGWGYAVGGAKEDATSQTSVERIRFDEQGAGEWIEDRELPAPRSHHGLAAYDNALYVTAGLNRFDGEPFPYEDENFKDVLRAEIGEDGALGEWMTVGQLPSELAVHASFAHAGFLYVVGGLEGPGHHGEFVGKVQRAAIAEDGTVGTFETLPSVLPIVRGHCHQVPLVGPVLYSVAGAAEEGVEMKSQADAFFARLE